MTHRPERLLSFSNDVGATRIDVARPRRLSDTMAAQLFLAIA
jgi:hypothetical protein